MFCTKCGAAVTGKYCSCCGQKVRSQKDELELIEKRLKKEFCDSCTKTPNGGYVELAPAYGFLALACWEASVGKYKKLPSSTVNFIEAVNSLDKAKYAARDLFQKLKDF